MAEQVPYATGLWAAPESPDPVRGTAPEAAPDRRTALQGSSGTGAGGEVDASGSREFSGLPALMRHLADLRTTGRVRVRRAGWTGDVALDGGRVVAASFGSEFGAAHGLAALAAIEGVFPTGHFVLVETPPPAGPDARLDPAAVGAWPAPSSLSTGPGARAVPAAAAVPRLVVAGGAPGGAAGAPREELLLVHRGALRRLLSLDGRRTVGELVAADGATPALTELAALSELGLIRLDLRPAAAAATLVRSAPAGAVPDRLLRRSAFLRAVQRAVAPGGAGGGAGVVAILTLSEGLRPGERSGGPAREQALRHAVERVLGAGQPLAAAGRDENDDLLLLLPATAPATARRWLARLARELAAADGDAGGGRVRVTPAIGYTTYEAGAPASPEALLRQAAAATAAAAAQLDLQPVRYQPDLERGAGAAPRPPARGAGRLAAFRLPAQIAATQLGAIAMPLLVYALLARFWVDITPVMYLLTMAAMLVTGALIWIEGLLALEPRHPPEEPKTPYPPASAIIAAYLPNEATTILDTIEAFLRQDYPAGLQIILAYNTPHDLPVEAALREIAARDPRFVPLRVAGSTSKAQNVNAAVGIATGAFTGVFDADHHPDPGSFARAWRWLDTGFDVVQGHCLIRNGADSWIARLVAVEFEAIYAVSHPGRARLHGFGIFGGSNGYWRTALLRQTRFRTSMLTEDIDAALRVVEAGHRICADPFLVSRELAPLTLQALWHQRMRWAQGWFQVSLKHTWPGVTSPSLSPRQKAGFVHLLLWRELYPWLSMQMYPIILFWLGWYGPGRLQWLVPIWVLTSLQTLSVGPGQTFFSWWLAEPQLRKRGGWFLWYLVVSSVFYTPFKNLIAVVAQVKEAMCERTWKITPRLAAAPGGRPAVAWPAPAARSLSGVGAI